MLDPESRKQTDGEKRVYLFFLVVYVSMLLCMLCQNFTITLSGLCLTSTSSRTSSTSVIIPKHKQWNITGPIMLKPHNHMVKQQ